MRFSPTRQGRVRYSEPVPTRPGDRNNAYQNIEGVAEAAASRAAPSHFPIVIRQSPASAELRSSVDGSRDGVRVLPIYGPVNGWLL